jgi:hypothetical protein
MHSAPLPIPRLPSSSEVFSAAELDLVVSEIQGLCSVAASLPAVLQGLASGQVLSCLRRTCMGSLSRPQTLPTTPTPFWQAPELLAVPSEAELLGLSAYMGLLSPHSAAAQPAAGLPAAVPPPVKLEPTLDVAPQRATPQGAEEDAQLRRGWDLQDDELWSLFQRRTGPDSTSAQGAATAPAAFFPASW